MAAGPVTLGPISAADLAKMSAKSLKDPAVVELYRTQPFLAAYAAHTDRRVAVSGPRGAVGNVDDWEAHGRLQAAFLRAVGLAADHRVLEVGCGTGRLARHLVPSLAPGGYTGVDISLAALEAARRLALDEGWGGHRPVFTADWGVVPRASFDLAWAYSVVIHLPPEAILQLFREVAARLAPGGRFYWSFVPEAVTVRTGLKQFRATLEVYRDCALRAGLSFASSPGWIELAGYQPARWTGSQHIAVSTLA